MNINMNKCYTFPVMGARKVSKSKINLQGHSRSSLLLVPFNRPHMTSY